jgi:hypothetical protein
MADYVDSMKEEKRLLSSFRGRRLLACRALDQVKLIIDHIGIEEGEGRLLPPEEGLPPVPSNQIKREMKNLTSVLLRLILTHNDGHVSNQELRTW